MNAKKKNVLNLTIINLLFIEIIFFNYNISYAQIKYPEIKGVDDIFLTEFKRLSPIQGYLALETNLINNIRFNKIDSFGPEKAVSNLSGHSNKTLTIVCHPQIRGEQRKNDCPQDFTSALIQHLFPSPAGLNLVANTRVDKTNPVEKLGRDPVSLGQLLGLISKVKDETIKNENKRANLKLQIIDIICKLKETTYTQNGENDKNIDTENTIICNSKMQFSNGMIGINTTNNTNDIYSDLLEQVKKIEDRLNKMVEGNDQSNSEKDKKSQDKKSQKTQCKENSNKWKEAEPFADALIGTLKESFENSPNIYPENIAEKALLAFFWERAKSKGDILQLAKSMPYAIITEYLPLITSEVPDKINPNKTPQKAQNAGPDREIRSEVSANNLYLKQEQKKWIDDAYTEETFLKECNQESFDKKQEFALPIFCIEHLKIRSSNLPPVVKHTKGEYKKSDGLLETFPDCVETSIRNFFDIVFYNKEKGIIDYKIFEEVVKKFNLNPFFKEGSKQSKDGKSKEAKDKGLVAFYKRNFDNTEIATDKAHYDWSRRVANKLKHDKPIVYNVLEKQCNISSGVSNTMKVFETLLGDDQGEDSLNALERKANSTEDENEKFKYLSLKWDRLCKLFSRENFKLDWKTGDIYSQNNSNSNSSLNKTINKDKDIFLDFSINGTPTFKWSIKTGHSEVETLGSFKSNFFEDINLCNSMVLKDANNKTSVLNLILARHFNSYKFQEILECIKSFNPAEKINAIKELFFSNMFNKKIFQNPTQEESLKIDDIIESFLNINSNSTSNNDSKDLWPYAIKLQKLFSDNSESLHKIQKVLYGFFLKNKDVDANANMRFKDYWGSICGDKKLNLYYYIAHKTVDEFKSIITACPIEKRKNLIQNALSYLIGNSDLVSARNSETSQDNQIVLKKLDLLEEIHPQIFTQINLSDISDEEKKYIVKNIYDLKIEKLFPFAMTLGQEMLKKDPNNIYVVMNGFFEYYLNANENSKPKLKSIWKTFCEKIPTESLSKYLFNGHFEIEVLKLIVENCPQTVTNKAIASSKDRENLLFSIIPIDGHGEYPRNVKEEKVDYLIEKYPWLLNEKNSNADTFISSVVINKNIKNKWEYVDRFYSKYKDRLELDADKKDLLDLYLTIYKNDNVSKVKEILERNPKYLDEKNKSSKTEDTSRKINKDRDRDRDVDRGKSILYLAIEKGRSSIVEFMTEINNKLITLSSATNAIKNGMCEQVENWQKKFPDKFNTMESYTSTFLEAVASNCDLNLLQSLINKYEENKIDIKNTFGIDLKKIIYYAITSQPDQKNKDTNYANKRILWIEKVMYLMKKYSKDLKGEINITRYIGSSPEFADMQATIMGTNEKEIQSLYNELIKE
ncbi:MAG: hypothetical protein HQK49_04745 [Oligoflexia bacterium]|nr:hypothetical protein [Oligoflexia bacterium]